MRVSQTFNQSTFLRALASVKANLNDALSRQATGQRVRYASDDPSVAAELLRLSDEAQKLKMRRQGVTQARPWLQMTEQGVSDLGNVLNQALLYATQGASDTLQGAQLDALAEQVAGLREQVQGLTNLRVGDRYVFSGTLSDSPPYDPTTGAYQGNATVVQIPLDDVTAQINMSGFTIFGQEASAGPPPVTGSGALHDLQQLEAAFRAHDNDAVRDLLPTLRATLAANSATLARVGTQRKLLEDADLRIADRQTEVSSRMSDLGAADMAQAISDVQQFTTGYQATLSAGSFLFGKNFFNYIG